MVRVSGCECVQTSPSVCGRVIIYIVAWWSDGEWKEREQNKKGLMNNTPGFPTCRRLRFSEEFKEER